MSNRTLRKATRIKIAATLNRLSFNKRQELGKLRIKLALLLLRGYCSQCKRKRLIRDKEIKRLAGRIIIAGKCIVCETEIYKSIRRNDGTPYI